MSLETIDFARLDLEPGDRILDVGCGEGRHTITAYLLHDVQSVGVDLAKHDLDTAASRFRDFEQADNTGKSFGLAVANGETLPFANESFDKVICSEVLEHVPDYPAVLQELTRVLKTGGVLAVSVPRFFPEWVCWQLSDEYHLVEGGHVRIFNAGHLKEDIERLGYTHYLRHWAHSLHVPYWWLKCLFWRDEGEDAKVVQAYHKFLVWDLMKRPRITYWLDKILNPLLGKSVVLYFVKRSTQGAAEVTL